MVRFLGSQYITKKPNFDWDDHIRLDETSLKSVKEVEEKCHQQRLDLAKGIIWKFTYFKNGPEGDSYMLFEFHHGLMDGNSMIQLLTTAYGCDPKTTRIPPKGSVAGFFKDFLSKMLLPLTFPLLFYNAHFAVPKDSHVYTDTAQVPTHSSVHYKYVDLSAIKKIAKMHNLTVSSVIIYWLNKAFMQFYPEGSKIKGNESAKITSLKTMIACSHRNVVPQDEGFYLYNESKVDYVTVKGDQSVEDMRKELSQNYREFMGGTFRRWSQQNVISLFGILFVDIMIFIAMLLVSPIMRATFISSSIAGPSTEVRFLGKTVERISMAAEIPFLCTSGCCYAGWGKTMTLAIFINERVLQGDDSKKLLAALHQAIEDDLKVVQ